MTRVIFLVVVASFGQGLNGQYVSFPGIGEIHDVQARFDNEPVAAVVESDASDTELFVVLDFGALLRPGSLSQHFDEVYSSLSDPLIGPASILAIGPSLPHVEGSLDRYVIQDAVVLRYSPGGATPLSVGQVLVWGATTGLQDAARFAVLEWLRRRSSDQKRPVRVVWTGSLDWLRLSSDQYVDDFDRLREVRTWSLSSSQLAMGVLRGAAANGRANQDRKYLTWLGHGLGALVAQLDPSTPGASLKRLAYDLKASRFVKLQPNGKSSGRSGSLRLRAQGSQGGIEIERRYRFEFPTKIKPEFPDEIRPVLLALPANLITLRPNCTAGASIAIAGPYLQLEKMTVEVLERAALSRRYTTSLRADGAGVCAVIDSESFKWVPGKKYELVVLSGSRAWWIDFQPVAPKADQRR